MTVRRAVVAAAVALALTACSRTGTGPGASATPGPDSSGAATVGYVRMQELIKKHPLYPQLARYDDDIAALNLTAVVPHALAAGPELAQREAELQRELKAAGDRTNAMLQQKSKEYEQRENAAIAQALREAGGAGGVSVPGVAAQMEKTAQGQLASASAQAQRDLDTYRRQLESQDRAQVTALQQTLTARADRTYRAKVDELTSQEAALSLKLASDDAAERLSLRTKLASLAMDQTDRKAAEDRLAQLDKNEADQVAALHARDEQTLAALHSQLQSGIERDLGKQVAQIRARSLARLQARQSELRAQFAAPSGPLVATTMQNGKPVTQVNPNLPPALRERIRRLHDDYSAAFRKDADATIAEFNRMRADLQKRYDQLTGLDSAANRSAQDEIAALERKRTSLYDQMVAQIDREVKLVAQQHGVAVVVNNVAAPARGVDLTDAAAKDIESLHE